MGLLQFASTFFKAALAKQKCRWANKEYRHGRRMLFEVLEPRLIMSGNLFVSSQVAGISEFTASGATVNASLSRG